MGAEKKAGIKTYRDLLAWQKGMDLAEHVCRATGEFPAEEKFGLVAQLRRAAVSVPANIAEGFGRENRKDFRRFLRIAHGSLFEVQTHGELPRRLGWLRGDALAKLRNIARQTDAVLTGLIRSVSKTPKDRSMGPAQAPRHSGTQAP